MKNSGIIHYGRTIPQMATNYQNTLKERRLYFFNFLCNGASNIYSTAEDLFLWHKGLLSDKLLSPKYKKILLTPSVPEEKPLYAYGWYVLKYKHDEEITIVYGHSGGGSNTISRVEEHNHFIVILNNIICPKLDEMTINLYNIIYNAE